MKKVSVKLKHPYTSAFSNLDYGIKKFDQYLPKFNFEYFLNSSVKMYQRKSKAKFNLGFTNHCRWHYAILKAFCGLKGARGYETRGSQFLFQNLQNEIFEIFKVFKKIWNSPQEPVELTQKLVTETAVPYAWLFSVVTIVGHFCPVVVEGL